MTSAALLLPLILFAFVSSITPGPNNLMLLSSGMNFGIRRTIPHMFGISIGFSIMLVLVGLGLTEIFSAFPVTYKILQIVSVIYLCYLAYKIAFAPVFTLNEASEQKPFSFLQAALFQWVNPKAWSMALSAISIYCPERSWQSVCATAAVFGFINLPVVSVWTILGVQIRRIVHRPKLLRAFNIFMAILLVGSLYFAAPTWQVNTR